jgi:hypothetical protein
LEDWGPGLYSEMGLPEPEKALLPAQYHISFDPAAEAVERFMPEGTTAVKLVGSELLTPDGYDRDIRHYGMCRVTKSVNFLFGGGRERERDVILMLGKAQGFFQKPQKKLK